MTALAKPSVRAYDFIVGLIFGHSWEEPLDEGDERNVSYSFASKKDPRFRGCGRIFSIGGVLPAVSADIAKLEKDLHVSAPDDIEYSGVKD